MNGKPDDQEDGSVYESRPPLVLGETPRRAPDWFLDGIRNRPPDGRGR